MTAEYILILAAIAVVIWWSFRRKRSTSASNDFERAAGWLRGQGIDPDEARFSHYTDCNLSSNKKCNIVVGTGHRPGEPVGFVIEVDPVSGVVDGLIIDSTTASWHKSAAMRARQNGMPLILELASMDERRGGNAPRKEPAVPGKPDMMFMVQLPSPDTERPQHVENKRSKTILYYENPKTIGEVSAGVPPMYEIPQCAVVTESGAPQMIVRVEESGFGSMLCVVTPDGNHRNLGTFKKASRDAFLAKVAEVSA